MTSRWPILAILVLSLALAERGAVAQPSVPAPASNLGRLVPREDLVAYWELEGLDAHSEAWRATAAQKLLNDTELGELLENLATQIIDLGQQSSPVNRRIPAAGYLRLLKHAAKSGVAIGVVGKRLESLGFIVTIGKANRPEHLQFLNSLSTSMSSQRIGTSEPPRRRGRELHSIDRNLSWWVEGDDLILCTGSVVELVLDVADGKGPSAAGHPLREAVRQPVNGFRPVAYGFIDAAILHSLSPPLDKLGLDGLEKVEMQWGFDSEALRSTIHVLASAPRQGMLSLFDQPTFGLNSLPPIPMEQTAFGVFSVEAQKTYERVVALAASMSPGRQNGMAAIEAAFRKELGVDLRTDLLAELGPEFTVYVPTERAVVADQPLAELAMSYGRLTLSVQVKHEAALAARLDRVIVGLNRLIAQQPGGAGTDPPQFRRRAGSGLSFSLEYPAGSVPDGLIGQLSPTIGLNKNQLVISGTAAAADKALELAGAPAERRWTPANELVALTSKHASELTAIAVTDPRLTVPIVMENLPAVIQAFNTQLARSQTVNGGGGPAMSLRIDSKRVPTADRLRSLLFPATTALAVDARGLHLLQREAIPSLASPATCAFLAAFLMPATQPAREAAWRAQCINNLKQILLAMHNHLAAHNQFPHDITDKDGKPLLSWRVSLLPFLEQAELYNKFKLDEPWDSPHNKALLKEMPAVFRCPDDDLTAGARTSYRAFVGHGALFETGQSISLAGVTDGTSNTVAVVEAKDAVPWTKPDDLPFDEQAQPSLFGAGSQHPGGFHCGFADGSVSFLRDTVAPAVFKALITRAGGEVVSRDAF